jgi:hypothetical protein
MRYQRHLSGPARRTWERVVARARVDEVNAHAVACAPRFVNAYEAEYEGRRVTMFVEPVERQVRANGFLTRERIVETATGHVLGVRAVDYGDIAHNGRALAAHAGMARRGRGRLRRVPSSRVEHCVPTCGLDAVPRPYDLRQSFASLLRRGGTRRPLRRCAARFLTGAHALDVRAPDRVDRRGTRDR